MVGQRATRRTGLTVAALCVALLTTAAPAAAAADELRPIGATGPIGTERLSDERTVTRFANVRERAVIRRHPETGAPPVARLRTRTEDGLPEVYVALRAHLDATGRPWVKVRIPARPNGRRGWVPRPALGAFRLVRTRMVVNRRLLRATLYRNGRKIWTSRIGIGAPRTPTPRGSFYVRELLRVPRSAPLYGPWAFGTSAYSVLSDWPGGGVVGIHGTDRPDLIPGRPSHGCVRVPNRALAELYRLMPIGTPFVVQ